MTLATLIHAEQRAQETRRPRMTPAERTKIIIMLKEQPLARVLANSGRSISTVMRIAQVAARTGEL